MEEGEKKSIQVKSKGEKKSNQSERMCASEEKG